MTGVALRLQAGRMQSIQIPSRTRPLAEQVRLALRRAVNEYGVRAVAEALPCSRHSLLAGLAGVGLRLEVAERLEAGAERLAAHG